MKFRRRFRDLSARVFPQSRHGSPSRPSGEGEKSTVGLCTRCRSIRLPTKGQIFAFDLGTTTEVLARSNQGCRFCKLVAIALDLRQSTAPSPIDNFHVRLDIPREQGLTIQCSLVRGSRHSEERAVELEIAYPSSQYYCIIPYVRLTFQALDRSSITQPVSRNVQKVPTEGDSDITVEKIKAWIKCCTTDHTCGGSSVATLPTRVLDVSIQLGDTIRLYIPPQVSEKAKICGTVVLLGQLPTLHYYKRHTFRSDPGLQC